MEKIKLVKDVFGGTLTVWFADPDKEHTCSELENGVVLMKGSSDRVKILSKGWLCFL